MIKTDCDLIKSNTRKTIWLIILFPASFAAVICLTILLISSVSSLSRDWASILMAAGQTASSILPIASVTIVIWILVSYFAGQNFILFIARASELTEKNAPEIINTVKNIAIIAGISMPRIYMINDEALNAFATGRDPKHSYIVLTKGIVNKLEKQELEGVIAHEIAHIKNRDTRLMLITIACISFATIAAELLMRYVLTAKIKDSKNKNGAIRLFLFAFAAALYIYGYLVAPLIKLALSRTREFQADATAALITRNPQGLIDALKKISNNSTVKNLNSQEAISPICIANPLAKNKSNTLFSKISGLFATHPPIEERIKALQNIDARTYRVP